MLGCWIFHPTLHAQNYGLVIEEYAVHSGMVGSTNLAGYTTYRFYVTTASPTDFVSSVFGNNVDNLSVQVPNGMWNSGFATGATADGINAMFLGLVPSMQYDSYATIGITSAPVGNQVAIASVQSPAQPWQPSFVANQANSGQSLMISDATGGAWYTLNGTPNGVAGDDLKVLIMQVTTAGPISGQLNIQIFPNGIGANGFKIHPHFNGTEVWFEGSVDCTGVNGFTCEQPFSPCDVAAFTVTNNADFFGPAVSNLNGLNPDAGSLGTGVSDAGLTLATSPSQNGQVQAFMGVILRNDPTGVVEVNGANYTVPTGFSPDVIGGPDGSLAAWNAIFYVDLGGYTFEDISVKAILDFNPVAGNPVTDMYVLDLSGQIQADATLDAAETSSFAVSTNWAFPTWSMAGSPAINNYAPFDPTEEGAYAIRLQIRNDCGELLLDYGVNVLVEEPAAPADVLGCTNPFACNYNPAATVDNGTCDFLSCLGLGCTDPSACNYNPAALLNDGTCEYLSCIIPGCTLANACNYNPEATVNNGTCEFTSCVGCTDPGASNYNPDATTDNGSCIYPGCVYPAACNYEPTANVNDGSCEYESCSGCTIPTACNYDPTATIAVNSTCVYASTYYNCAGVCLQDTDGDGICNPLEVQGCTDPLASNYNAAATDDNGSCTYSQGGCLIPVACNYNPNAVFNDGSCEFTSCVGCINPLACNFDAAATLSDLASCTYAEEGYDCAGNCLADQDSDGVCDPFEVIGCQNVAACNFNPAATDPGACTLPATGYNCAGGCLADTDGDGVCNPFEVVGCQDPVACNFAPLATDAGTCNYAAAGLDCEGDCLQDSDGDGVCDADEVAGCTDADALNFNPLATDDDASCSYTCTPDLTAPTFVFVPADSTITCDQDMPTGMAMAVDACDPAPVVTYLDGPIEYIFECPPFNYFCTRVFTATDAAGNTATATQFITVVDTVGPVFLFTPPAQLTVNEPAGESLPLPGVFIEDACDLMATWTHQDVVLSSTGTTTLIQRTYTATDACGNATVFVQSITVLEAILGCNQAGACNFNAVANVNDGSCQFPALGEDCSGNCLSDTDGDGICDAAEVAGCTADNACNYNPTATDDNGSCDFCSCQENLPPYGLDIEWVASHTEGALAGTQTYRMYVTLAQPTDFVSSVFGNANDPLLIASSAPFVQVTGGSNFGQNLNPAFFPLMPDLAYDSWVTIGLESAPVAGQLPVQSIVGPADWAPAFSAGGAISLSDDIGGMWFVLNGASNGVAGEDLRVLVGQFTTAGTLSGTLNVQIFVGGAGSASLNQSFVFDNNQWLPNGVPLNACGCTNALADNYDPEAEYDDGNCVITGGGCTDEEACNFDSEAWVNDGSCVYAADGYDCAGTCLADADGDGVCDEFEVLGCQDATACNFDAAATDAGDCIYPEALYDCSGQCLDDVDGDGICDTLEIPGCTDVSASNFDLGATDDDGSCVYCAFSLSNIVIADPSCAGFEDGSISWDPIGAENLVYSLSPSGAAFDGDQILGLGAGTYVLFATDALGCTAEVPFNLIAPPAILLNATVSDVSCSGLSNGAVQLSATGGAGGFVYGLDCDNWQPQGTFPSLAAGAYSFCAEDITGCQASISVEVMEPNVLEVNLISVVDTEEDVPTGSIDIEVTGGTAPYNFDWAGVGFMFFSSEEDLDGLNAGTYALEVTDAQGCFVTLEVEIETIVATAELSSDLKLNVYPNPASEWMTIELGRGELVRSVVLEDLSGRAVRRWDPRTDGKFIQWAVSDLPNGSYFVQIQTDTGSQSQQVVISH